MNKHQLEYLGEQVKIVESKNTSLKGLEGKIIKETKNTFTIRTNNGDKTVTKETCVFHIKNQKIHGNKITRKPEERIKIKR